MRLPCSVKWSMTGAMSERSAHQPLHSDVLWLAMALGLGAGFASAVVLGLALGGVIPIGPWWSAVVQAHGHAQLTGWTALFILGIGFFFLPRMRGAPLALPRVAHAGALLVGTAVALRFGTQVALALGAPGLLAAGLGAAGVLQLAGAAGVIAALVQTFRTGPPVGSRAGVVRVLPFLAPAWLCFLAASALAAFLTVGAARRGSAIVDPVGDRLYVELLLHGFAIPIAFGVSVQTLPLFLRLPAPHTRTSQALGLAYAIALLVRLAGTITGQAGTHAAGAIAGALVTIAFVLFVDVVFRFRAPWTDRRLPYVLGERTPMRPGMPDRGEFGRFEWLVRGAYAWLLAGAVLELLASGGALAGGPALVPPDAARHALTLGFVTLLICGMAVRMIPGFAKRPLPAPRAVAILAVLGHAAATARVVPLLLPAGAAPDALLAASGLLGFGLVATLALLLRRLLV